jgi:hypothetical protein
MEFDRRPTEYSHTQLKTTLTGRDTNTYKMTVCFHDEQQSQQHKDLNWNRNKITTLSFDKRKGIFYSKFENGIPIVAAGGEIFYYFKGNWCYKDNHMFYPLL